MEPASVLTVNSNSTRLLALLRAFTASGECASPSIVVTIWRSSCHATLVSKIVVLPSATWESISNIFCPFLPIVKIVNSWSTVGADVNVNVFCLRSIV